MHCNFENYVFIKASTKCVKVLTMMLNSIEDLSIFLTPMSQEADQSKRSLYISLSSQTNNKQQTTN